MDNMIYDIIWYMDNNMDNMKDSPSYQWFLYIPWLKQPQSWIDRCWKICVCLSVPALVQTCVVQGSHVNLLIYNI